MPTSAPVGLSFLVLPSRGCELRNILAAAYQLGSSDTEFDALVREKADDYLNNSAASIRWFFLDIWKHRR